MSHTSNTTELPNVQPVEVGSMKAAAAAAKKGETGKVFGFLKNVTAPPLTPT